MSNTAHKDWIIGKRIWEKLVEPAASIQDPEEARLSKLLASCLILVLPLIVLVGMIVMPLVSRAPALWQGPTFLPASIASIVSLISYAINRLGKYPLAARLYVFVFVFSPWLAVYQDTSQINLPIAILMLGGVLMSSILTSDGWSMFAAALGTVAGILLLPVIKESVTVADISAVLSVIVTLDILIIILTWYRNRLEQERQAQLRAENFNLQESSEYNDERLAGLIDAIVSMSSLDFSQRARIGNRGDMYDAVATGLNALGEELQATTVSKTYLDNIILSMTDSLIVVSPEGIIQTTNAAALKLLGYTQKEMVGHRIGKVFAGDAWKDKMVDPSKSGSQATPIGITEGEFIDRNGRKIPVLYSCSAILDAAGARQGMVCVAHNISARVRTERLLKALNNAARAMEHILEPDEIFSTIGAELRKSDFSCSVFILDRERELLFLKFYTFDSKAVQLAETLLSTTAREFPIPMRAMEDFWRVLSTGNTVYTTDIEANARQVLPKPFRQLAGHIVRTLDVQASIITPLFLENEIDGLLLVHSDDLIREDIPSVTAFANQVSVSWRKVKLLRDLENSLAEKNMAEAELIKHRDHLEEMVTMRTQELEAANIELTNFAYVASHDLKAPLRAISQLSSWIAEDYAQCLDQEGRDKLFLLIDRTRHMHNLIEGILQYSRIGRVTEKTSTVNLDEKVKEIISLLAPPETIHIIIDEPLPVVTSEPTYITQVFQNLLSNAIQYIDKPEGNIRINSEKQNGEWLFSVADNGPGIEEKYHEKIFQMFQTLGARRDAESTGIGLALVKRIVEKWGGRVWVESELGKGSTFYFTLPHG